MIIRKAHRGDLEFVFLLRNEEAVRLASFESQYIDLDTHREWFEKKITSNDCVIFIAEIDAIPIGQVRFDVVDEKTAEVNFAVSENFRGKGYGKEMLKESSLQFFDDFPAIQSIHAFIKTDNISSIKSFERAGYIHIGEITKKSCKCKQMLLLVYIE